MTSVEIIISGLSPRAESIRSKLPFAAIEKETVVIRSQLGSEFLLNDHLVWLWGFLKHERKVIKNLQTWGGSMICRGKVPKGNVSSLPNGAEMLHLLNIELVFECK